MTQAAMTISLDTGPFQAVLAEFQEFMATLAPATSFAELDDTQLGAIALRLPQFAGDAAEAMTKAGVPMQRADFGSFIELAESAAAEIARRIEAR